MYWHEIRSAQLGILSSKTPRQVLTFLVRLSRQGERRNRGGEDGGNGGGREKGREIGIGLPSAKLKSVDGHRRLT